MPNKDRMVTIAQFAGSHGVRGEFKLRAFTEDPGDAGSYGELVTADGRTLTVNVVRVVKDNLVVARAPEIKAPEDCDAFKGALLLVPRDRLPPPEDEDEFYLDDLVGLAAVTSEGAGAGRVKAVVNYGAGDLVELFGVPGRKGTMILPFTKEAVPAIDLANSQLTVVLPEEDGEDEGSPDRR